MLRETGFVKMEEDAVMVETEAAKADKSLGRVQLRAENGEVILIPKPSSDPNDPLNWSTFFKYYVAIVTCYGMFLCTFLAAGPTVALIQTAVDFGGTSPELLPAAIAKVAFFFTASSLTQGTGNLIWMPLIQKYGKRPWYIISFTGYFITAIWCGATSDYTSEVIARVLMGFFSGAGECLGPATITDVFFLHQRGSAMAMYNFATGQGVSLGIIICGAITIQNSWRVIYWTGAAMIGVLLLLIVFTFPETAWNRSYADSEQGDVYENKRNPYRLSLSIIIKDDEEKARVEAFYREAELSLQTAEQARTKMLEERIRRLELAVINTQNKPKTKSYWSTLKLFTGERYTSESLWTMFIRPFGLIFMPPVIWSTCVLAVLVGFTVAISSSFANDFATAYQFTSFQSGLCFFGPFVGGILAIPAGGPVGDMVADYFTVRNGGYREPEFRLPAMAISVVLAPLGLFLYGLGLQQHYSFMVPVVGLGLLAFASGSALNISFVYTLDAYSAVSGEVTIAQLAFKSIIGFGLSAGTNTWIANSGELLALSEMALITLFVLLVAVPMFFYGARMRRASLKWRVVQFIKWDADRERI